MNAPAKRAWPRDMAGAVQAWLLGPRRLPSLATWLVASAAMVWHAWSYVPFFADDGFISLRYAQRLLAGQGLTWTDGERVEGYSNLLWILATNALGALGLDLVLAARVVGLSAAAATIAALIAAFAPARWRLASMAPAAIGALALAASGSLAVWAIGGLEQPLQAALLAWGLARVGAWSMTKPTPPRRAAVLAALPLALLCWTRPDGILLAFTVTAGAWLVRGARVPDLRRVGPVLYLPAAFVVAQLAFRIVYYGAWIPNSGLAKLAWTPERWGEGARYLTSAVAPSSPLIVLAATAIFPLMADSRARRRIALVLPTMLVWALYVAAIGGDIFPARRHLVPLIVGLAWLAAHGVAWFVERGPRARFLSVAVSCGLLAFYLSAQVADPENVRARGERWEWDGEIVGAFLARHFGATSPLLAVDSAGNLPYFSRLPSIDMLGINDEYLARHRPADFGRGALGHELGNGAYVFERQPDIVIFGLPRGETKALYRSGVEMQQDPRWSSTYQLLLLEPSAPRTVPTRVWVRRESPKLGFVREPDRIIVPGFLLAHPPAAAREDGQGRLGAIGSREAPIAIRVGDVPPGRWRIGAIWTGVAPEMSAQVDRERGWTGPAPLELTLEGKSPASIDIALRPRGGGLIHVRQVEMIRCP